MSIVAILSTTVLPLDGVYEVQTIPSDDLNITNIPHYINHPATKEIVERLGAVPAQSRLFPGLNVGESALAFAIAQGKSSRATLGFTNPHQDVSMSDLTVRRITRLS